MTDEGPAYRYSIPEGVISTKPGSVNYAVYAEIHRRGGEASHEQLLAVAMRHIGPRTGEPLGRARARYTIWRLVKEGRLDRRLEE